ncbi:MAG: BON domain-containing protein [Actinomycetota bacterium]|nr:BON domain-containing protein [Actinomycetota bacterium]
MLLLRKLLPFSRITLVLWAWRNRASVLDWATFALRSMQSATSGAGLDDAKTEFRLRANLARDRRTRGALVDVTVEGGVAHLAGRVGPEVHAVVQDITVATPGVIRLDDRITHTLGRGGLLKRRARGAA